MPGKALDKGIDQKKKGEKAVVVVVVSPYSRPPLSLSFLSHSLLSNSPLPHSPLYQDRKDEKRNVFAEGKIMITK